MPSHGAANTNSDAAATSAEGGAAPPEDHGGVRSPSPVGAAAATATAVAVPASASLSLDGDRRRQWHRQCGIRNAEAVEEGAFSRPRFPKPRPHMGTGATIAATGAPPPQSQDAVDGSAATTGSSDATASIRPPSANGSSSSPCRRSAMRKQQAMSHGSFFSGTSYHTLQRTRGSRRLLAGISEGMEMETPSGGGADIVNAQDGTMDELAQGGLRSSVRKAIAALPWGSRARGFFNRDNNSNHSLSNASQHEPEPKLPPPPDSEVERIVQRLEDRNANRVHVPAEVKSRFLKLCKDACEASSLGLGMGDDGRDVDISSHSKDDEETGNNTQKEINESHEQSARIAKSPCILKADVIAIRQAIRLEVENRTTMRRITDEIKEYFGFRCHCKVLFRVLNRAIDLIDESAKSKRKKLRRSSKLHKSLGEVPEESSKEFYYKDFAFYHLKVESKYPWMRNAGVFSILLTLSFYLFTPILWCTMLDDRNICSSDTGGDGKRWLSALYFASATMSTVGYGDVTVLFGSNDVDTPEPENWRIFLALLFMILSMIVSVVGFQAGLDSQFHPFRRRLNVFGRRVYEILRDANILKGRDDKHEEIISRMRWSKFSQLAEIFLIFMILNLVGVFALQLSLLGEGVNEATGDILSLSWMESFYWAVQTTTTIGYGDVVIPDSLRWFLLLYLAFSTYFVGSAFGKLGELSKRLESMQRLYLWQQQEASYTMLHDFSGRPNTNPDGSAVEFEPEIDQFEFTIASLVVMGKITRADVKPILEKFKHLTGKNSKKITSSDVSGPTRTKKADLVEVDDSDKQEEVEPGGNEMTSSKFSSTLKVGKKIVKAFQEEMLSSSVNNNDLEIGFEDIEEEEDDYSDFRVPKNTHAIAIDDSKIQRKLLAKIFDNAGISPDRCTICGDGFDEIMGFEDYVVKFMESHDGYVFIIVDENLDVVNESSTIKKHETISGSQCVENIRRRLPPETERRMFALIRSANDSSSDIAIYKSRAHGFLPKAPIKREKMNEALAPLWWERFPRSEFGESMGAHSRNEDEVVNKLPSDLIACSPFEIEQKVAEIEALFQRNAHETEQHLIHDVMHELKGDLLTLNSNTKSVLGQINLIQVTKSPETLVENWQILRKHINDIIQSLQKNFRVPKNTYAIAIDDSKIQRKLLSKFFQFLAIPTENCTVVGNGYSEIKGFEDLVVNFMQDHSGDYVLVIVDESLDCTNCEGKPVSVSGSKCVDNIRQRLPDNIERRLLALVRSANDSKTDVAMFNERTHGFLPKAPIRREKVNETLAPMWMKRFPPSEFGDSAAYYATDEAVSINSDSVACNPNDIAHKVADIEALFKKQTNATDTDMQIIRDQLHELKGDLLTFTSDSSMIPILGMINLMLLQEQSPELIVSKWHVLQKRIDGVISSAQHADANGQSVIAGPKIRIFDVLLSNKGKDSSLNNHSARRISLLSSLAPSPASRSKSNYAKTRRATMVDTSKSKSKSAKTRRTTMADTVPFERKTSFPDWRGG